MKIEQAQFLKQVGLATRTGRAPVKPVLLTGAATDPETGLIVSLASAASFAKSGVLQEIKLKYWRQLPYGQSSNQTLITLRMAADGTATHGRLDEIWVQSQCVYDARRDDALDFTIRKKINRVLEAVSRINGHLREKGPVEQSAKILSDCCLDDVLGEELILRGLKKTGGFDFLLAPSFMARAGEGARREIAFNEVDPVLLKTILGFSINTLEPDKNFATDRELLGVDPQSGLAYATGVKLREGARGQTLSMEMYIEPHGANIDATRIPDLVSLRFRKDGDRRYVLEDAKFSGQPVDVRDTRAVARLIGIAQASNREFGNWKYPAFMDSTAKFDLLGMLDPLHTPPSLDQDGGEFLYVSLHGTGLEKKIENFGDQIGAASVFLHRGTRADGTISTVGVAIDFPFATGGPQSNFDGAVPDYLPFWDAVDHFCITHDHFDHCDGLPIYAKAGLMRHKTVICTARVKYFLDKKMDALKVDRADRPKMQVIDGEGAFPIRDETGMVRLWVQSRANAIRHSSHCTPFLVSGWYGDRCKGSALVLGDGNGLSDRGRAWPQQGLRSLPALAAAQGLRVDPQAADRNATIVLHDPTAIRYEGHAPKPEQVEDTLATLLGWFKGKGVLLAPISTNAVEYTIGLNVAHRTGRDITAVGRNAELRLSCMNLFGVLPDDDLSTFSIAADDALIPSFVRDLYQQGINEASRIAGTRKIDRSENPEAYDTILRAAHARELKRFREEEDGTRRDDLKSTALYMLEQLQQHGAVRFANDVNGYLMRKAIRDEREDASIRGTRSSDLAKSFREREGELMVFITGTQGNAEEKFSTIQKFTDFFSLLDADEEVQPTGYKIDASKFVAVISQPAIPGNEVAQDLMIAELVRKRDITVVGAFLNGFKVYNARDRQADILRALRVSGWQHECDSVGNISVYNRPIHFHGHGFRQDVLGMAKEIPADHHEVHHMPDADSYDLFRGLMRGNGLNHSGTKPEDFQVMRIDGENKRYDKVAQLNPSYMLVRMARKYGAFYGGWLELVRATMLRRDGGHRTDGLMARSDGDGFYAKISAQRDWEKVSNPTHRTLIGRERKMGPSGVERRHEPVTPNSMPMWSIMVDPDTLDAA